MANIYAGDSGIEFRVSVVVDITAATLTSYKVIKPDGTTATWAATRYDNTTLTYTTQAGDMDLSGEYKIQAYVEFGPASKHTGETARFKVYKLGA